MSPTASPPTTVRCCGAHAAGLLDRPEGDLRVRLEAQAGPVVVAGAADRPLAAELLDGRALRVEDRDVDGDGAVERLLRDRRGRLGDRGAGDAECG